MLLSTYTYIYCITGCKASPDELGDGFCNVAYNSQECKWDGGDCCRATCFFQKRFACGDQPYYCLDPAHISNAYMTYI